MDQREIYNRLGKILQQLGGVPGVQTGTPNPSNIGASASGSIPSGVKYTFVAISGTITLGGVTIPAGVTVNGGPLTSALVYTTGASSSAYLYYETFP